MKIFERRKPCGQRRETWWKHVGNIEDCSVNEPCSLDRTLKFSFVSFLTQLHLKGRNYTRIGKTKLPSFELKPEKYEKLFPVSFDKFAIQRNRKIIKYILFFIIYHNSIIKEVLLGLNVAPYQRRRIRWGGKWRNWRCQVSSVNCRAFGLDVIFHIFEVQPWSINYTSILKWVLKYEVFAARSSIP